MGLTPDDQTQARIAAAVDKADFSDVPVPDFTEVTAATIEASGVPVADLVLDPAWAPTEYE